MTYIAKTIEALLSGETTHFGLLPHTLRRSLNKGVDFGWGQDRITSSVFAADAAQVGFEPHQRHSDMARQGMPFRGCSIALGPQRPVGPTRGFHRTGHSSSAQRIIEGKFTASVCSLRVIGGAAGILPNT